MLAQRQKVARAEVRLPAYDGVQKQRLVSDADGVGLIIRGVCCHLHSGSQQSHCLPQVLKAVAEVRAEAQIDRHAHEGARSSAGVGGAGGVGSSFTPRTMASVTRATRT